jgi:hypothetical protein
MKLGVPFLQLPLQFDAQALAAEVQAIDESAWRPHPAGYEGNDALLLITQAGNPDSDATSGPMQPTPHLLRCPYLMQVLESIGATWGRSRLMRLSGRAEVTPHVDINYYWRERARVHVPIVTQPTVRFICGAAEINMRAGECWIFDTWAEHNVVNDHYLSRIHLVADTVGGAGFWDHVRNARPHDRELPGWRPRECAPIPGHRPELDYEGENFPAVMTPWEIRVHYAFLLGEARPHAALAAAGQSLLRFARVWQSLWARFGEQAAGWGRYREAIEAARHDLLACGADGIALQNGVRFMEAVEAWILQPALGAFRRTADAEIRNRAARATVTAAAESAAPVTPATAPVAASRREQGDPVFDRPVFIVCPPRSGSTLLFETLAQAPGLFTIGQESHQLIEAVPGLAPAARGFDSNRLEARDATPPVIADLRARFVAALRDRDESPPAGQRLRMLEKTPKNALRVPFLARVFPEARFVYLHRDPRHVLASMLEAWQSGRFRTYPNLPGWKGLPWSLLLVPGWRNLIGQPLEQVVATQWQVTTRTLLDDLEQLPRASWSTVRYESFVADPAAEIQRVCDAHGLGWDRRVPPVLPLSTYTVTAPDPGKWRRYEAEVGAVLPGIDDQVRRAEHVAATTTTQARGAIPA